MLARLGDAVLLAPLEQVALESRLRQEPEAVVEQFVRPLVAVRLVLLEVAPPRGPVVQLVQE